MPSDLLSTTTICFSKLNSYIVWCSSCGPCCQNLIEFADRCCATASTECLTCTFAESQNSLHKSGHEHYNDLLKHCMDISYINTEILDCFMGVTFSRSTCCQILPHKLGMVRLESMCMPCTYHPCLNCSENLPRSSFHHLLSKYANRTSALLCRKVWCLFHSLFYDCCQTCLISHFIHRNATAVYSDFCHVVLACSCRVGVLAVHSAAECQQGCSQPMPNP
jgi:hypothetical protein